MPGEVARECHLRDPWTNLRWHRAVLGEGCSTSAPRLEPESGAFVFLARRLEEAPSAAPAAQPNASGNTMVGAAGNTAANASSSTNAGQGGNASTSDNGQNGSDTNQGIVVAKGSFEVHDVFHANVMAAVAFSTLKNQSITKQPQPQLCTGTPANPDPNCFSPLVSSSFKWAPIVGLDYYFQPRDTFPRSADFLCRGGTRPWR